MPLTLVELNQRSIDIFKELVEAYVETGGPVGSHTLSRRLKNVNTSLSPATIRNVMADLEEVGLLYAPHISAGRIPTTEGLRFFVNGLLEVGGVGLCERKALEEQCRLNGQNVEAVLERATSMLSGLCQCAGIVITPKVDLIFHQIEFIHLSDQKALAVLIAQDGLVENRLMNLPKGITQSILEEAANYLNHRLKGAKNLATVRALILEELATHQNYLNELTSKVVETGLAAWSGDEKNAGLIVKGQSNLLLGVTELQDLEQIRRLFGMLEKKQILCNLLEEAIQADGVQIFIGAENNLFNVSGCSLIVSPLCNGKNKIIGALGVIGPSRMQYGRIIPLVDYTAKLVSNVLSNL